jgi:hypothetical protein
VTKRVCRLQLIQRQNSDRLKREILAQKKKKYEKAKKILREKAGIG